MDRDEWQGLTARTSEGRVRGVVVGMFKGGPLAGWLRVHACRRLRPRPERTTGQHHRLRHSALAGAPGSPMAWCST